jgi:hypothetical protein
MKTEVVEGVKNRERDSSRRSRIGTNPEQKTQFYKTTHTRHSSHLTPVTSNDDVIVIGIKLLTPTSYPIWLYAIFRKIFCIARQIPGIRIDIIRIVVAKIDCRIIRAADTATGFCRLVDACVEPGEVIHAILNGTYAVGPIPVLAFDGNAERWFNLAEHKRLAKIFFPDILRGSEILWCSYLV